MPLERNTTMQRHCNILKFPTEILGEIFDYYVHDRSSITRLDSVEDEKNWDRRISAYIDSRTDPIDLTHVCRMWRTTAISIPSLWATIHVHNPKSEKNVELFKLWLERSAGPNGLYPLDLTIKQRLFLSRMSARSTLDEREDSQVLEQIISLAVAQHQRWKYISLELRGETEASFRPLYTTTLPILCGFKLDLQKWSCDKPRQLMGVLCSSPELQSITLGRNLCNLTENQLLLGIVPWDRLTTLNFTTLEESIFLRILSSTAVTLQHISVSELTLSSASYNNSPPSRAVPQVTMHRLQSIHIGVMPPGDAAAMFDKLDLPAIRDLRNFTTLDESICLRILSSAAVTLQHISVSRLTISSASYNNSSPSRAVPQATMHRLQSIHIGAMSPGSATAMFDKLDLPALRDLCLPRGFGAKRPRMLTKGWNSLLSLLERSRCKLLTLEFGDDNNPSSRFTEVFLTQNLKSSPVFEHLTKLRVTSGIGQHPGSLQLLDALSEACEDSQEPRMLPLLETLMLDSILSVEDVRRMVSDRIAAYGGKGKSKLRRVSANFIGRRFALDMVLTSRE